MRFVRGSWLIAVALLGACGANTSPGSAGNSGTGDFMPVADVQQLMRHVIDPAADEYWDAVGWIVDAEGEHVIEPQSEEEWHELVNHAYMVAESGNLLMLPDRAMDQGAWMALSQAMVAAGKKAIAAAEAKDKLAVFDAGAEIYATCNACHAVYATRTLRPSATQP